MVRGYDTSRLFREDTLLRIRDLEADIAKQLQDMERLSKIAKEQDERVKALEGLMSDSKCR